MVARACAELQGSTFLVITQQAPPPSRMSHFTAEVKGQPKVLQSQGRAAAGPPFPLTPRSVMCSFLLLGEMDGANED